MDIRSLPDYPYRQVVTSAARTPPRSRRFRFDLICFVVIVAGIVWLKSITNSLQQNQATDSSVAAQIDFDTIRKKCHAIRLFDTTQRQLEVQFGQPTVYLVWGEGMSKWEPTVEHSHRHLGIPEDRIWYKWVNPQNEQEWLAVLVADRKVYKVVSMDSNNRVRFGCPSQ